MDKTGKKDDSLKIIDAQSIIHKWYPHCFSLRKELVLVGLYVCTERVLWGVSLSGRSIQFLLLQHLLALWSRLFTTASAYFSQVDESGAFPSSTGNFNARTDRFVLFLWRAHILYCHKYELIFLRTNMNLCEEEKHTHTHTHTHFINNTRKNVENNWCLNGTTIV